MARRKHKVTELEHCTSIREYEASVIWKHKSAELLADKECTCEICGRKRWYWQTRNKKWKRVLRFAVHHKRYNNLPNEPKDDLTISCYTCHNTSHLLLRMEAWGGPWGAVAAIIRQSFTYEGIKGFKPW